MLQKKTDNFNDFSRYYSEENQDLLEKESKFIPFTSLIFFLFLLFLGYFLYDYFSNKKTIPTSSFRKTHEESSKNKITANTPMEKKRTTININQKKATEREQKREELKKEKIKKLVLKEIKKEEVVKNKSVEHHQNITPIKKRITIKEVQRPLKYIKIQKHHTDNKNLNKIADRKTLYYQEKMPREETIVVNNEQSTQASNIQTLNNLSDELENLLKNN